MPSVIQGHKHRVVVMKQSAEGTPATTGGFEMPAYDGEVNPSQNREMHEVADGADFRPGAFISRADGGESTVTFPSFPQGGAFLDNALLGVDTVTGAADPFSHAQTLSVAGRKWLTVAVARPTAGGVQWDRIEDARVKAIDFQAAAGMPLKRAVMFIGKKATGGIAAPTGMTAHKLDNTEPFHSMIGATLKIDLATTPAATQIRYIESLSINVAFPNAEFIQTDEVTPRYEDLGLFEISFSADIVLEDYATPNLTFYNATSPSSAALTQNVNRGALDFLFNVGPTPNANRTLQIVMNYVEFAATYPTIDPSGRGLRTTLTGTLSKPTAGEPITITSKYATGTDLDT